MATAAPESERIKRELTAALRASESETEKLRRALAAITGGDTTPARPRRQRAKTSVSGKASNGGGATRRTRSRRTTADAAPASSATKAARTPSSRAKSTPRGNRKRAKPGANQAAVLAAAGKNPGSTVAELTAATGVTTVANVVRVLTERGQLTRETRDGRAVYRVPTDSAAAAPATPWLRPHT
jgi:hypothetical protein